MHGSNPEPTDRLSIESVRQSFQQVWCVVNRKVAKEWAIRSDRISEQQPLTKENRNATDLLYSAID